MIPVLVCPILNRPDLLAGMLASVDEPVGRLYVVDNGSVVTDLRWPTDFHVVNPGYNMGVAASWNFAIKANIGAPWWLFVNNDVVFAPGELGALARQMEDAAPKVIALLGFAAVAINAAAIDLVGWFDEGFTPMYYEDSDWCYRAKLVDLPRQHIGGHSVHLHEQTTKSDAAIAAANQVTRQRNRARYIAKWGGPVTEERYLVPWNGANDQTSVDWLRQQTWQS